MGVINATRTCLATDILNIASPEQHYVAAYPKHYQVFYMKHSFFKHN